MAAVRTGMTAPAAEQPAASRNEADKHAEREAALALIEPRADPPGRITPASTRAKVYLSDTRSLKGYDAGLSLTFVKPLV